jgi:cobalt transport protein ATP-binding subunit
MTPTATSPAVEVDDLHFTYPDGRPALRGVDLRVEAGTRVAILGPNGSGKTTLVLHLNGVLRATRGAVRIGGTPVDDEHVREVRRRVGLIFQDPDDQLFMPTVRRDVAFGPQNLGLDGDEVDDRVRTALDQVGMAGRIDRTPGHLSMGERRRVALATVLAMEPEVLVFDEPSANLDPVARRDLAEVIVALGLTSLIVTHDLLYALELCPRAVLLDDGAVVASGPTPELLADADLLARHRLELPRGVRLAELAQPPASSPTKPTPGASGEPRLGTGSSE